MSAPRRRGLLESRRTNDRGSLLLVGMMIILVLAGIAIIGARNVIMEFSQVGNYRTGEQALRVTEAGLDGTFAMAVTKGDAFPEYVEANSNKLTMADVSQGFYDTTAYGSFGPDFQNVGGVNWVTVMSLPVDTNRVPGYPVNENFIWKKYRFVTSGAYGDEVVTNPDDTLRNASRQFVSYGFVGPFIVGGAN